MGSEPEVNGEIRHRRYTLHIQLDDDRDPPMSYTLDGPYGISFHQDPDADLRFLRAAARGLRAAGYQVQLHYDATFRNEVPL